MQSLLEMIREYSFLGISMLAFVFSGVAYFVMKAFAKWERQKLVSIQKDHQSQLGRFVESKDERIAMLHEEVARLKSQLTEDQEAVGSSLQEMDQQIEDMLSVKLTEKTEESRKELEDSLRGLRERLDRIEKRFPSTETIEHITSINEAILTTKIESISTDIQRIEQKLADVEKNKLTQWDIAKTVFAVLSVIAAATGIVFGIASLLSKAS